MFVDSSMSEYLLDFHLVGLLAPNSIFGSLFAVLLESGISALLVSLLFCSAIIKLSAIFLNGLRFIFFFVTLYLNSSLRFGPNKSIVLKKECNLIVASEPYSTLAQVRPNGLFPQQKFKVLIRPIFLLK